MDTAPYAAIRALIRALTSQKIIDGPDQVKAIMREMQTEANSYRARDHEDIADALTRLASDIGKDAWID